MYQVKKDKHEFDVKCKGFGMVCAVKYNGQ